MLWWQLSGGGPAIMMSAPMVVNGQECDLIESGLNDISNRKLLKYTHLDVGTFKIPPLMYVSPIPGVLLL